jgi:hypothetical protein
MRFRLLHSLLIALLAWSSLPAWSVQARNGHGRTLACVHACAVSDRLMTQDGKLAGLGQGACSVSAQDRVDGVVAPAVSVAQPDAVLVLPAAAMQASPAPGLAYQASAPRRGPPEPCGFLSSEHPQAQAPPQF